MIKYLREKSEDIDKCPKKYLTLIGGLIIFVGINASPVGSSNAPYYLSYMQDRANSTSARYANTVYSSNFVMVFNALSAIISGLLKNKYKFSFKQMHFFGFISYT